MKNYFRGTKKHPYHLSVGAVLINDENEVRCHYFKNFRDPATGKYYQDFYILMRETPEPGETIEKTLRRGLMEELGAKGDIVVFVGSLTSTFWREGTTIQKTTLYFLMKLRSHNVHYRKKHDRESGSEIHWLPLNALIRKMRGQKKRLGRTDLDETEVLARLKNFL